MNGKIRFFVRGVDSRPCAGVHVSLIVDLAMPKSEAHEPTLEPEMHAIPNAGAGLLLATQRIVAAEFGLGSHTVAATALTDFNGYAVIDLAQLGERQSRLIEAAFKLSLLDRGSDLRLSLLPPLSGRLSLLTGLNQFHIASPAELDAAVGNAQSLAFGACQALVINAGLVDGEAVVTAGKVQEPDACDYELSPASFVARPRSKVGDDGCEHLVPTAFPVRQAMFSRVVVATELTKKSAFRQRLPSLDGKLDLFASVQWGELLEFQQSWFSLGHSLGEIKYSLPLAPGEAVRVAVVDFSRTDGVLRKDDIRYAEKLRHQQSRVRDIDNIVSGTLDENQSGNSTMVGGAIDVEYKPDSNLSIGGTVGAANSVSYSSGNRDLSAEEQQNIHDVIMQRSAAYRELSSSVVVQASQDESNHIATRIVANMNRGHALTVNYYEILRHLLVRTEFKGCQSVILVPVQPIAFRRENISRFRSELLARLLDPKHAAGFDAIDRLLGGPDVYSSPPLPGGTGGTTIVPVPTKTACTTFEVTIVSGKHGANDEADTWGSIVVSLESVGGGKYFLFNKHAGTAQSFTMLGAPKTVVAGSPVRTFKVTRTLTDPVNLDDIIRMRVSYTSFNAADAWNAQSVEVRAQLATGFVPLTSNEFKTVLLAKDGEQFLPDTPSTWSKPPALVPPVPVVTDPETAVSDPRPVPTIEGDRGAAQMLENHLNANAIYYSMTIWANLNKSERKLRLRAMLGEASQLVGDDILAVVGNLLAFRYYGTAPGWMARKDPAVPKKSESITTLPTRGVFAEAHLGHCNAAEKRDITRLWNFSELPVSLLPNIEGLTPGPKGSPNTGIGQNALPPSVLNIVNPQAAPDPTGLANALTLLRTPEIFRNMAGLQQTSALLGQLIQSAQAPSLNGAPAPKTPAQQQHADQLTAAKAAVDQAMVGTISSSGGATRPSATEAFDNLTVSHDVAAASHDLGWTPETSARVTSDLVGGGAGGGMNPLNYIPSLLAGAAPVHIRGLSGLGNADGSGTTTGEQILDGTKNLLGAIATGVADWKSSPHQALSDAVALSITSAITKAGLDAADTIPLLKAIKVSVELSKIFADGVGESLNKTNAQLARSYRQGELVGGGSDGLSAEDIEAIQNCRRWQANSVGQINSILLAGIEAVGENLIARALTWASSEVVDAASGVAKQLVGHYLTQSGTQAMLADALTELGSGIPATRAKFYKEVGTTVVSLYLRQLRSGSPLRATLAPFAKMGGNKPLEKMLLTAFASMLVDPIVRNLNTTLRKSIAAEAKALVLELRAAGQSVMAGSGVPSANAGGVTLPSSAYNEIESGPQAAEVEIERDLEIVRQSMVTLLAATKARASVLAGMRQNGLARAWQRWELNSDDAAWLRQSARYSDEVTEIRDNLDAAMLNLLAGLDQATRDRAAGEYWFPKWVELPILNMDQPQSYAGKNIAALTTKQFATRAR